MLVRLWNFKGGEQKTNIFKGSHCRFLVPENAQKILTEIRHHFWFKNDGEKWSRKNYFKIPAFRVAAA